MFLEVSEVSVAYAGRPLPAVSGVSFGLQAGDIGVLLGPSGCGKTTLLRAIAGLEPVTTGTLTLEGAVVGRPGFQVPAESRGIGMVFQDHALFPHLSVGANIAFGLHGMPKAAQAARVADMLALVGLAGMEPLFPHALSGGQQQRVALARALAPGPRLLLLDEPFSSLDLELRERLATDVRSILKRTGTTAVMVTHDQQEAFALGDFVGVMHAGSLHQWARPAGLYAQPQTRFVAGFIGQGMFVPARIDGDAASRVADTAFGRFPLVQGGPPLAAGTVMHEVLLRAEDLMADAQSPLRARVVSSVFRGADCLCTIELSTGEQALLRLPGAAPAAVGDWVGVRAAPHAVPAFARAA